MKQGLLSFLLICAAAVSAPCAAPPDQSLCPDGSAPILIGHPFRPLLCVPGGKEPKQAKVDLSSSSFPDASDKERADLKPLEGAWRGLAYYGGQRFEVTLEVDGSKARWIAMDYRTNIQFQLNGRIRRSGWFSRGQPQAFVKSERVPQQELSGPIWIGAAPLVDAQNPPLDRLIAWSFSRRPEAHRVYYAVRGDTLRARYVYSDPARGELASEFELTRQR